jgi:NAD(P)-dependent dehydrogenase (short-subunit alcohol dehydrogenase family)
MTARNWLITGVSSGFGRELATQLLGRGDIVVGTVRRSDSVADLVQKYPDTFRRELLDVTDAAAIRDVVDRSFTSLGRIDVVVSNAGYGLFGAAEELSDDQVTHIIATNLTGSIQLIRAALPHLRAQGSGRIIQMSTYGGQVAFPGNSMYHATKWGIEGFAESVAQEVVPFGIGVTIVEPGGARTEFRYGSARVADRETGIATPESQSVYGSLLLRGALAAAQHDDRATAHEMLAEAAGTARRLGSDANLRGTAFGPVNTQMHQVNVAVTLGDAGTAIDLARQIDLRAVTITERKASLLIDVARAFFQWGKYEQAHAALRAAEDTAPQEVATRPSVGTLARDLATLAPAGIRRDAEQFASRIGVLR